MKIRIKKLSPLAKTPRYATNGAACFDLYATALVGFPDGIGSAAYPGLPIVCRTGLAFEIPPGWVMKIYSRSGHGFNHDARLANCVGVIDSDFRGEVMVKLTADGHRKPLEVRPGDRIAQAMIERAEHIDFELVDDISETARGAGGLGSTGAA